jgi:hypothetical protein
MEARQSIVTFIVRVTESDGTGLAGTVQRVKTGERHRFRGTSELARILEPRPFARKTRREENAPAWNLQEGAGRGSAPN